MATPLTADFDSPIKNVRATQSYIAATGTVIYRGGLVQANASGLAIAALGGSALKILGRAVTALDGTEAAGSTVTVEEGDIFLKKDSVNPPVQASVGAKVYATSDNEVGIVAGTNAVAGICMGLATGPLGTAGVLVRSTLEANS